MAKSFNDILGKSSVNTTNITTSPKVSVSDMITREEVETSNDKSNKLNQYFADRSNIRKSLSTGTLKTGRPAEDAFNIRAGKLIDLYLDDISKRTDDNGKQQFTTEQIISASKDMPGTLQKMKNYYQYYKPEKVWAIDDYIQKGGMATNVFEYLQDVSGTINNPYGVKQQGKEKLFDEGTPEVAKGIASFGSFIPSLGVKSVGKLGETKIGKWMDEKLYDTYHKVWDTASDEEYKKYKSGVEEGLNLDATNMGGINKRQLYEGYDKALSEGFIGSIDEYKNFEKNVHNSTSQALNNVLQEGIISKDEMESSKGALIGDAIAEFITYLSLPVSKEINEIDTARPLINKIATVGADTIINTLEFAGLEGLKGDLEKEDIGKVGLINLLVSGVLRGFSSSDASAAYGKYGKEGGKFVRKFLSTLPEKVENAFKNMSSSTLEDLWNIAKEEARNPEAQGTVRNWLGGKGVKALEKLQRDITDLGKEYETKLTKLDKPVSEKGFFEDINKSFKELENQGALSRGKGKSPELQLVKDGERYKVNIKNKKNLNRIKNEDGKGLGDAIQDNIEAILEGYGIKLNEGSQYLIKQAVSNATKGTNWNVYEQQTRKAIEGLENRDLNMPEEVKNLGTDIFNKKQLLKRAQKTFGVEGKYSGGKVGGWDKALEISEAGKNMNREDAVAMINILKDEGYLDKNINSEIAAQGYLLGIENQNAGYSFLKGFYPSKAGEIEQILELLRQKATAKDIERYIKMLKSQEAKPSLVGNKVSNKNVRDYIGDKIYGGEGTKYNRISDVSKTIGGGTNILTDGEKEKSSTSDYLITDKEEYNRKFNERFGGK